MDCHGCQSCVFLRVGRLVTGQYILDGKVVRKLRLVGAVYLVDWLDVGPVVGMSSIFASTYPEMVQALVMIDLVKPVGRPRENVVERTRLSVENQISIENKLRQPNNKVYKSEQEALDRLLEDAT